MAKVKLVKYKHLKSCGQFSTKIIMDHCGHGKYKFNQYLKDDYYLGFIQYHEELDTDMTQIKTKQELIDYLKTFDDLRDESGRFISATNAAEDLWIENNDWTYS